jgi:hypothetical protein
MNSGLESISLLPNHADGVASCGSLFAIKPIALIRRDKGTEIYSETIE